MALSVKVNQIAGKSTGTGAFSTTDPGFQPKGLILTSSLQTTAGAIADVQFSLGVANSGTTERMAGYNADDNVATSDTSRVFLVGDVLELLTAGATGVQNLAGFTSFDANGFSLNYAVNTLPDALLNYITFGGTDITNVLSGSFASNTTTGNQAVTGLGFQPDLVILFATLQTASGQSNNHSQYTFGVMDAAGNQWSMTQKIRNAQATMATTRAFANDKCFVMQATTSSSAVFQDMAFVSMDSDGFTVNITKAGGSAILIGYLAIKGGQWKVGTDTQKTSTGTKATTGIGFTPSLVMFGATGQLNAGVTTDARLCFGATDGTRSIAQWTGGRNGSADSICNTILSASKCLIMAQEGTSATPTIQAEAQISSLDSDGFTLNWTTADSNARIFGYIALGANATPAGYQPRFGFVNHQNPGIF